MGKNIFSFKRTSLDKKQIIYNVTNLSSKYQKFKFDKKLNKYIIFTFIYYFTKSILFANHFIEFFLKILEIREIDCLYLSEEIYFSRSISSISSLKNLPNS